MTERMMQGYMMNGDEVTGEDYHGDPHPYNSVCDSVPKCRDAEAKTPRRMYLDPANGMTPHAGAHDENSFCESAEPKCVVFDRHRSDQGGGSSALVGKGDWRTPPDHYATGSGIQPWDVWDEFGLDKDAYLANTVKYILRAGKKPGEERLKDLRKAANYIAKAIDREENRE